MANYSERFTRCFDKVAEIEGLVSNHPSDPGGLTVWGVTKRDHPDLFVNGLPSKDQCMARWYRDYWPPAADAFIHEPIALEVLEAGILCGPQRAAMFLQNAYNELAPDDWVILIPDGVLGPKSLDAINRFCRRSNWAHALYRMANQFQGDRLRLIGNKDFLRGWFAKRLD